MTTNIRLDLAKNDKLLIRLDLAKNDKLLKSLKTLDGTKKIVVFLYKERGKEPITLEIFKNKLPVYECEDIYNVYARSVDNPSLLVLLGTANIIKTLENIQNSNETLSIMNYTKESSVDYEDIRKILDNLDAVYSLAHSVNYFTIKTSAKKDFVTEDIEIPFPLYAGSVSMDNSFLKVESTVEHKEKSPISDYFPEMSIKTIDNKIKTNLVSFSCSIPNIFIHRLAVKDNNSIDTENLSAIFEIGNKVFNGTIVRASIDTDSKIVGFPLSSHISTIVSLEILIDNDSKKIIQNLLDKTDLETAAVGKLMLIATINDNINYESTDVHISLQQIGVIWVNKDSLLNNSNSKKSNSTATESEKNTQEVLKQRHSKVNYTLPLSIASSMLKSDLKKPLKKWNKILKAEPIEIFTDTFSKAGEILGFCIKESSINGTNRYELVAKYSVSDCVASSRDRGITTPGFVLKALRNAYIKYKQRKSENLDISHLESLLEKNQKASNQKRDKDLINIIAESLREIGGINKTNISKRPKTAASEDLFCKKIKANSKKDSNTTRPHNRPYQIPSPAVTILTNDESKEKVKEIIEEANKAKSFPYMLDYDNNCVVKISDSLFDILECRNKLEDILKVRKDIDVGIFTLEPTEGLVFKKLFNISSLAVYHSASKNLYALIGIY